MFVVADQSFVIRFDPFQLEVPGRIVVNARDLFHIEHKRTKPAVVATEEADSGSWEETFNGHKDSKPKGPQAISVDISFPDALHVYGIPQHATSLSLKPTVGTNVTSEPYRLYNLDVFEYLEDSPFGLYGSIPYLTAVSEEFAVGVFWLNAAEMYIDIDKTEGGVDSQWLAESGALDLFLLLGPTPAHLAMQFASLTGKSAMPQMFSIGYHQCRYAFVHSQLCLLPVVLGKESHDALLACTTLAFRGSLCRSIRMFTDLSVMCTLCCGLIGTCAEILTVLDKSISPFEHPHRDVEACELCRWNYRDEADVKAVSQGFDEHLMPCDVVWLDIEHTDGKKYMTWDASRFPDPTNMLLSLSSVGRKMVTIVDPHVKRDSEYDLHNQVCCSLV